MMFLPPDFHFSVPTLLRPNPDFGEWKRAILDPPSHRCL